MVKKVSKVEANNFLSNVADHKKFWTMDGAQIFNLTDLSKTLKTMKKDTFLYHVNKEKNDFANWVYDCLGDIDLTNSLRKSKSKADTLKKVAARITELKKIKASS